MHGNDERIAGVGLEQGTDMLTRVVRAAVGRLRPGTRSSIAPGRREQHREPAAWVARETRAARAGRPPPMDARRRAPARARRRARAGPSPPARHPPPGWTAIALASCGLAASARRSSKTTLRCQRIRAQRVGVVASRAGHRGDPQAALDQRRGIAREVAARVRVDDLEARQPDLAAVVGVPVARLIGDVDDHGGGAVRVEDYPHAAPRRVPGRGGAALLPQRKLRR